MLIKTLLENHEQLKTKELLIFSRLLRSQKKTPLQLHQKNNYIYIYKTWMTQQVLECLLRNILVFILGPKWESMILKTEINDKV